MLVEAILSLTRSGIPLEGVYDLPLDAFDLYSQAAVRLEAGRRLEYIGDTSAAVAALLSSKAKTKEYAESLEKLYLGEGADGRRKANSSRRRKGQPLRGTEKD